MCIYKDIYIYIRMPLGLTEDIMTVSPLRVPPGFTLLHILCLCKLLFPTASGWTLIFFSGSVRLHSPCWLYCAIWRRSAFLTALLRA